MGVADEAGLRRLNKSSSSIDMDAAVIDPKEKWESEDKVVKFVNSDNSESE